MVKSIHIKNFKSISDLEIELGRINIFIGSNGSGKTNILEAISFAGASFANKLDYEFFSSRGIRTAEPRLMHSAFNYKTTAQEIFIEFLNEKKEKLTSRTNYDFKQKRWIDIEAGVFEKFMDSFMKDIFHGNAKKYKDIIDKDVNAQKEMDKGQFDFFMDLLQSLPRLAKDPSESNQMAEKAAGGAKTAFESDRKGSEVSNFIIYNPENSALRNFYDESQILPLGVKGEGLYQELTTFTSAQLDKIRDSLKILDWVEDLAVPKKLLQNEKRISIADKYLDKKLKYFDQRSSNEGFLYFLFYLCLFESKSTPKFFAVDNIDVSFNPRMCSKIIELLVKLSKRKDNSKQVILTTHNPAILDGIDLDDDEQRVFVVKRNLDGHTVCKRVFLKSKKNNIKLSEAWTRGYLGGLPENF